jgi:hypothetical protein
MGVIWFSKIQNSLPLQLQTPIYNVCNTFYLTVSHKSSYSIIYSHQYSFSIAKIQLARLQNASVTGTIVTGHINAQNQRRLMNWNMSVTNTHNTILLTLLILNITPWKLSTKLACKQNYTGLFKMIVGVLTTYHTQYTWDSSIQLHWWIKKFSKFSFMVCNSYTFLRLERSLLRWRHQWNHHRWHATNSLERTGLSCWCS